ncbi:Glutamate N-acetyltransferase [Candidatus Gugararchaeum adminiculabundum]|nr:Glutamate N-acetyltransferase [Candidatus Gugararchaeum adminiculabundum]
MAELLFDSGVTAAKGFLATGGHCGLKPKNKDLSMVSSKTQCTVAGVFTSSAVKSATVIYNMQRVSSGAKMRAIVINSGNANTCTGKKGEENVKRTAEAAAKALSIDSSSVFVNSTGMIGVQLPIDKIEKGVFELAKKLGEGKEHSKEAAESILTTDTKVKQCYSRIDVGGKQVTLGGMCKGSGMINPNMATMLCFITTDCAISQSILQHALKEAASKTFNCITVDGDMSTNDTVLVLANGEAGNSEINSENSDDYKKFADALHSICLHLAKEIVHDGEGASKFVEIKVNGCASFEDARQIGKSIANSNLVKTTLFGEDPNWGRIMGGIGASASRVKDTKIDQTKIVLFLNKVKVFDHGEPVGDKDKISLKDKEVLIEVDMGQGSHGATVWACDLSFRYVEINAEYTT